MKGMACMRRLTCLAAIVGFGLLALAPAMASPILWTLDNLAFEGGSTASGSFTFSNGTVSGTNLSLFFNLNLPLEHIAAETALDFTTLSVPDETVFTATESNGVHLFLVSPDLVASLAHAQVISLVGGGTELYYDLHSGIYTFKGYAPVVSGELVGAAQPPAASATPEPATWALLLTGGLMLVGLAWRRRGAWKKRAA